MITKRVIREFLMALEIGEAARRALLTELDAVTVMLHRDVLTPERVAEHLFRHDPALQSSFLETDWASRLTDENRVTIAHWQITASATRS